MNINISTCTSIPGWMSEGELYWLAKAGSVCQRIVEVGSWHGRSTKAFALHALGEVWAVDTWDGSSTGDYNQYGKQDALEAFTEFKNNLAEFIRLGKLNYLRTNSLDALTILGHMYGQHSFDLVFLDGDHSYETVHAELEKARILLKKGGVLCGHDSWMEGVKKALQESKLICQYPVGSIWTTTV